MHFPRLTAALALVAVTAACARPAGPTLAEAAEGRSGATSTTTTTSPVPSPWPALDTSRGPRVVITSTGVVAPVRAAQGSGWSVTTPCAKEAVVTNVRAFSAAHVVIDPGHGGSEVGAVSGNGIKESELNYDIARRVKVALERVGMTVVLTREGDYRLPIQTRAEIVNALKPKLFLSIHHNGGEAALHDGPGTEVYYQEQSPESKRFAGLLWEDLVATLKGNVVAWRGGTDAGAIYRRGKDGTDFYGVLRETAGIPAVLIEAAYLSNPAEAALLAETLVRDAEAEAIAHGIERYFTTVDPGSGFQVPLFKGYGSSGGGTLANCKDPKLQ
jgi:N-acetylmuramoyl-L-alanine amidase